MSQELKELRALLDRIGSAREILHALKEKYSSLEQQVALAMLSSEFQLHARRHPEFAEPFASLYRDQRKAIAGLVNLMAQKAGVPPINAVEIATSLMGLTMELHCSARPTQGQSRLRPREGPSRPSFPPFWGRPSTPGNARASPLL